MWCEASIRAQLRPSWLIASPALVLPISTQNTTHVLFACYCSAAQPGNCMPLQWD